MCIFINGGGRRLTRSMFVSDQRELLQTPEESEHNMNDAYGGATFNRMILYTPVFESRRNSNNCLSGEVSTTYFYTQKSDWPRL